MTKSIQDNYIVEFKNTVKDSGLAGLSSIVLFLINYISSILITREIGASEYGTFTLARTIIFFFISISLLGLNQGIIKFVSKYKGQQNQGAIRGTIYFSAVVIIISSLFFSIVLFALRGSLASFFNNEELHYTLAYFIILIPLTDLTTFFSSIFRGYEKTNYHVIAYNIILPVVKLLVFLIFLIFFSLTLFEIIITNIVGYLFILIFLAYNFHKQIKKNIVNFVPQYESIKILKFSIPLYLDSFIQNGIRQLPLYIIGYFLINKYLGIYGICVQLVTILTLSLTSFNLVFAPKISRLYEQNNMEVIEQLYKIGTKWIFTFSLGIFVIFVAYGREILSIFGNEFVEGGTALIILAIGELVNVSVGPAGFILVMTNRPRIALINSLALVGLTFISGILLVPDYGLIGAAASRAVSVVIINIVRLLEVYYFERIYPYSLNFIKPIIAAIISITTSIVSIKFIGFQSSLFIILFSVLVFTPIYIVFLYRLGFNKLEKEVLSIFLSKVGINARI